jgi:benzoyl-CoA reductase/2-hydroxyglutaryl-CoA dehydratase subunit BcrC/BadD/HgdB
MKTIAYSSPFVPAEWIAAHGMSPSWLQPRPAAGRLLVGASRGVCPYAGAMVDAVRSGVQAAGVVMTTACDQMRYAAAMMEHQGQSPVFLMNVPSTWETAAARGLYRDELRRLGRFLVRLGGKEPSPEELAHVMLQYDDARAGIREEAKPAQGWLGQSERSERAPVRATPGASLRSAPATHYAPATQPNHGVPLALVGGPLVERDFDLFDLVERAGGCVVLDATEGGERTLPAAFDPERTRSDPLDELVTAYFGAIPDVFRRPNDRLYAWLGERIAARGVRGILFRRYLWCDLWHAELPRLRQWSPVPVLDFEAVGEEDGATSRTVGRLEAFLEILR